MELVINRCFGGFSLSELACELLGLDSPYDDIDRDDYRLIAITHLLGEKVNGRYADLKVVEIPDEATDWHIDEYDGFESLIYVVDGKLYWA